MSPPTHFCFVLMSVQGWAPHWAEIPKSGTLLLPPSLSSCGLGHGADEMQGRVT